VSRRSVHKGEDDAGVDESAAALHDHGWIEAFDWVAWQDEAAKYVASPELLASADAETIRKLLTKHVRKDRECQGHLAEQFENGHILALLRRLKEISAAQPRPINRPRG
jgi:arylsulfatase A-like enzyme